MSISRRPLIDRKPAFSAITVSIIPKSGISVTSRELQKENKGKTSYSGMPIRQTTEGTSVLENRFWTEASERSNADGPLRGRKSEF